MGGAVLARLQAAVGPRGVRRGQDAACAQRPHLETRHRALQQVSCMIFSSEQRVLYL